MKKKLKENLRISKLSAETGGSLSLAIVHSDAVWALGAKVVVYRTK